MRSVLFFVGVLLAVTPLAARAETAVLAGGCFWCVESDLDKLPGVTRTTSGLAGGTSPSPTYKNPGDHIEAVKVEFDPAVISYDRLVHHFLRTIDVTDAGGQFCDRGSTYVSALMPLDEKQARIAQAALDEAARDLDREIATRIVASPDFYAVEDYHQDYYLSSDRILTRFGLIRKSDAYKKYREACGRDQRVREVWGKAAYETLTQ
ncbi:MAG: peptide-methionine (S)-S-oxide reductase MsrA [Alphaproteobacteria bacterium]|nr:peptide-methionine (S)-S-oxide reductase MsrA [Alphaproteobacteria bacterium]